MGRSLRAAMAAAVMLATFLGPMSATPSAVAEVPREHRVYVVADSVGLGTRGYLSGAFDADWQVVLDGKPAQFVEKLESNFVIPAMRSHPEWFGDHVVIAGGYNYPYWDPQRFVNSVDSIINTLTAAGVKHVYWVTLREVKQQYVSASAWRDVQKYNFYFPEVNQHLRDALERHPNLRLIDWAANADQPGLTYDAIHLNRTGATLYSSLVRQAVDASAQSVPDGSITRVAVPGGAGAAAAVVNLTTVAPRQFGFLTAWSCEGALPNVSVHNYGRDQLVAHTAVVPLNAAGELCVFTRAATGLIIDVTGVIPKDEAFAATTPIRWLDTRSRGTPVGAGMSVRLDLADVASAAGLTPDGLGDVGLGDVETVVVSLTAVGASAPGFLTASRCDEQPATSNVNYVNAAPVPNLVVTPIGDDGTLCIYSSATTDVLVDLFGVFDADATADSGNTIESLPRRLRDTRVDGTRLGAGAIVDIDVGVETGTSVAAAVLNVIAVGAANPGFITVYPCQSGRPESSNLNFVSPVPVSNVSIVAPDAAGHVCVCSSAETDLVVDLQAVRTTGFAGATPMRLFDSRRAQN